MQKIVHFEMFWNQNNENNQQLIITYNPVGFVATFLQMENDSKLTAKIRKSLNFCHFLTVSVDFST